MRTKIPQRTFRPAHFGQHDDVRLNDHPAAPPAAAPVSRGIKTDAG
jgi:hypothetical protein